MRMASRILIVLACSLLGLSLTLLGACKAKETKRTTIEMETPKTERKIIIESTKTLPDNDND